MTTPEYDPLAEQYKRCKQAPLRVYLERPTFLAHARPQPGRAALDLACGDGHFTRELADLGAAPVVGADISQAMIDLAEASEAQQPRGIRYVCAPAESMGSIGAFDLVTAAYLFNCATTLENLAGMWRTVAANLAPGGRFVGIYGVVDHAGQVDLTSYGVRLHHSGILPEGAAFTVDLWDGQDWFSIVDYAWTLPTVARLGAEAGLRDLTWHPPQVSAEGRREMPELPDLPPTFMVLTGVRERG